MAPLLAGFPRGTVATSNPLLALATLNTQAKQKEHTFSAALRPSLQDSQSFYVRLSWSDGEVDTPDRTVTPRRVLAKQKPQNFMANHQAMFGSASVNEVKVGYNRPADECCGLRPGRV